MDMVIAMDISSSMEAVDFTPPGWRNKKISRIAGAQEVIAKFVQQRAEDRLGLVVFAAKAFTQCPLSLDYSILLSILKSVRTGVIEDGTAIGNAILVSINRLRDSDAKSKTIILLTDGEDNASKISPIQAAEFAEGLGIRIFPILVGSGGLVDYPVGKGRFGNTIYQKIETKINPQLLENIASLTQGKFYRAVNKASLEEDFQDILNQMEKTRLMDPGKFTRHTERFQILLLLALLALLLEMALRWTRFRRFP
jgi:Ca-activated chloride channel family protein